VRTSSADCARANTGASAMIAARSAGTLERMLAILF
jgi:hypothetical protein